jgi:hypothetical protein
MATASPQHFDVILITGEKEETIGRVEADSSFRLKIVTAVDEHRQFLDETLQRINNKDVMHVEVVPPEGAPKFALYSRAVSRNEAGFLPELQVYLKTYYDLTLRPATSQ